MIEFLLNYFKKYGIVFLASCWLVSLIISLNSNGQKYQVKNINLTKAGDISNLAYSPNIIETFYGTMSTYGPDCVGCGGKVGCSPRQDVRNGNIYYNDKEFGSLRIIAADRKYPCGSIVKISADKLENEIYAIVLDRGGQIGMDKRFQVDLLFESEAAGAPYGLFYNTKIEFLRMGW